MKREGIKKKLDQWKEVLYERIVDGVKHKGICCLLAFMALISFIWYAKEKYPEWKEAHSGVPDVVSSMSVNNAHHLKLIANRSRIEDKEEFAREIIHMCQDNSFHSIRFSTDINGYPLELNILVYLNRKELEEGESVFEIEFSTDDFSGEYDIKNDADKFRLYLDREEIDFC